MTNAGREKLNTVTSLSQRQESVESDTEQDIHVCPFPADQGISLSMIAEPLIHPN